MMCLNCATGNNENRCVTEIKFLFKKLQLACRVSLNLKLVDRVSLLIRRTLRRMEPCDGSRCRSEPCGCAELPVVPKPEQPFIEKVLKRVGNAVSPFSSLSYFFIFFVKLKKQHFFL